AANRAWPNQISAQRFAELAELLRDYRVKGVYSAQEIEHRPAVAYELSDGAGTDTATLTITVTNTAPTATDDSFSTLHDTPLSAMNVLGNDDGNDGETPLTVVGLWDLNVTSPDPPIALSLDTANNFDDGSSLEVD